MKTGPFALLSMAVLAMGAGVASIDNAAAQEQSKVLRIFAEILGPEEDPPYLWTEEGSQLVVARREPNVSGGVEFAPSVDEYGTPLWPNHWGSDEVADENGNVILHVAGSKWAPMQVIHVSDSGVETVRNILFLESTEAAGEVLGPHAAGLIAQTGPQGDVTHVARVPLRRLDGSDYYAPDKWVITQGYPGVVFRISVGWFSK